VSHVAIVARLTVKAGKAGEYVAAFAPLLEQAEKEPGTLLYAIHRSKDDPHAGEWPGAPTMHHTGPMIRIAN
jgi:quinol monooxygenase YgiN